MSEHQHRLVIASIFRDESPYLAEWIFFHLRQGVDHFYLYDNESVDDYRSVLAPFIADGVVTLIDWPIPYHERAMTRAFADCLERVRGTTRWMIGMDVDEFLFSPSFEDLPTVLRDYEEHPGIVVRWQCYGSSGLEKKTDEPVIARFTRRARTHWIRNRRVKTIVDPSRTKRPMNPHHYEYVDGAQAVTELGEPVEFRPKPKFKKKFRRFYRLLGPLLRHVDPYAGADISNRKISVSRLRINHYVVKSREEFLIKSKYKKEKRRYDDIDYFAYHDRNEVLDPILEHELPAVRADLDALGEK